MLSSVYVTIFYTDSPYLDKDSTYPEETLETKADSSINNTRLLLG